MDLAAGLLCTGAIGADRPCRSCRGCRMVEHGNHPDLHRLAPEGAGGQVRIGERQHPEPGTVRGLAVELALLPVEGGARVAIVRDAHRMNEDAQSALLKTLEEPPAGDHDHPVRRRRGAAPADGPVALRAGAPRCGRDARRSSACSTNAASPTRRRRPGSPASRAAGPGWPSRTRRAPRRSGSGASSGARSSTCSAPAARGASAVGVELIARAGTLAAMQSPAAAPVAAAAGRRGKAASTRLPRSWLRRSPMILRAASRARTPTLRQTPPARARCRPPSGAAPSSC